MNHIRCIISATLLLVACACYAQSLEDKITAYNKGGHLDSSYLLLDSMIQKFTATKNNDSLSLSLILKAQLHERSESLDYQLAFVEELIPTIEGLVGLDHPYYLRIQNKAGHTLSNMGRFAEAISYFDRVIEKGKLFKNAQQVGVSAMVNKAYVLLYTDKIKEAMELAQEAIMLFDDSTEAYVKTSAYQVISAGYNITHDIEKSIEYSEKALEIVKEKFGKTHPNVAIVLSQIATAYGEIGNFKKSFELFNKAKQIHYNFYKTSGISRYLSNLLSNMSIEYHTVGEYQLAEDHILEAIKLDEQNNDPLSTNLIWPHLVATEIFLKTENIQAASYHNNRALGIIQQNSDANSYDLYHAKSFATEILFLEGEYQKSYNEAQKVYEYYMSAEETNPKDISYITSLIYQILFKMKNFKEAKRWIELNIENNSAYYEDSHPQMINSFAIMMDYNYEVKNHEENITIYNEIIKKLNNGKEPISISNCIPNEYLLPATQLYCRSLLSLIKSGDYPTEKLIQFMEEFEKYYDIHLSTIRSGSRIREEAIELKQIYEPVISLLSTSDPRQVVNYMEHIRAFHTRIILNNKLLNNSENEKFNNQLNLIFDNLEDSTSVDRFINASNIIEDFNAYRDSLFQADQVAYFKRFGLKNTDIENITSRLGADDLIIEYFQLDSLLYCAYISAKEVSLKVLDSPSLMNSLDSYLDKRNEVESNFLFDHLLDKEIIYKFSNLLIVPDSKLQLLNFEELKNDEGKFLLEDFNIRYSYSASILNQQEQISSRRNQEYDLLALAPGFSQNLKEKYTHSEELFIDSSWLYYIQQPFMVNLVADLDLSFSGTMLTQEHATEHNYKNTSNTYKIIHLGTHGELNDQSPMFSKLIFAKDSIEDGYLHTYEIFGQNLNADLAVLSACNSGRGNIEDGDGVLSLAHAFTHAGCPSIVMTLWEVDEKSTASILSSFYTYLDKGLDKSVALRKAKLDFLQNAPSELKEPYYWAGLVLIGGDAPIMSGVPYGYMILLGLVILSLIGLFYYNKKA